MNKSHIVSGIIFWLIIFFIGYSIGYGILSIIHLLVSQEK
jgi:hypothetical protein